MSKLRSFCELVRLPNVFTAVADVLAGYWLVGEQLHASAQLGMLMLASATLYSAGIVLNDLADREVDRLERPNRPLPAGRVTIRQAWSLGATLCIAGCLSALGAAAGGGGIRPFVVCIMLALAILSYDFVLKSTAIGPLNMGICRGLNVLMGLSAGWWLTADVRVIAPIALCGYVAAFSYFGRGEAAASARSKLVVPGVGIVCSIVLLGFLAAWRMAEESFTLLLWLALLIHMSRVTLRTIRNPGPSTMQYAMKTYIMGIVAFDAVIASAAQGWQAGAIVLSLLAPALFLGRWVYST